MNNLTRAVLLKFINIFPLLLVCVTAFAQDPVVKTYRVKAGLANSTVYYTMQDSRGFLWFCTETGVNRFDGHDFETFTTNDGLADNENFKSFEDSKGRIWFCSYNGKLSYYQDGIFYNESNKPALKYNSQGFFLFDIQEDPDGNIWFSNIHQKIYRYDGNAVVTFVPEPALSQFNSSLFYRQANALRILITISEQKMSKTINIEKNGKISYIGLKLNTGKIKNDTLGSSFYNSERCATQAEKKFGFIYIQNNNDIYYLKNDSIRPLLKVADIGINDMVFTFYYTNNTLWLGTRSHGIYKIDNPLSPERKVTNMFTNYSVTSICKDNEGGLWFTTWGNGIFYLSPNNMHAKTIATKLPFNAYPIYSITTQKKPFSLAAGTSSGIVLVFDSNGSYRSYDLHARAMNRIAALQYLGKGKLFASSDAVSEIIYENKIEIIQPQENSRAVKSISYSNNRILATTSNRIWELKNNQVNFLLPFSAKFIAIAASDDVAFYYSSTNGLYKYESPERPNIMILADTALKSIVNKIVVADDEIWVGTHGNGIFILKNDRIISHLTRKNAGLVSDICQELFYDGKKYFWQGTNNGISIIDKHLKNIYHNLSSNDGLISNDVKAICINENHAYIAAGTGISVLSMDAISFNSAPPKTLFNWVKFLGNKINNPSSVKFSYFKGAVDISFTGITFDVPEEVEYTYRFDDQEQWVVTKEQVITFFDLNPGKHTIELRAKKYNSTWSAPVFLRIEVAPLFWQTWLFKTLLILSAAGVIIFIARLRIQAVHNREKEKTLINSQISELENKALAFQMNPHFVFNSLNTVQQFILSKEEEPAINYLSDFATLMRQILNNSKKAFIPLQDEIIFLKKYLELEKIRFNNNFEYQVAMAETINPGYVNIPPMLLQPLVENAVKYSMMQRAEKGLIKISISIDGDFLHCSVEDDGPGINITQRKQPQILKKDSTALQVVKARLALIKTLKGEPGTITITDRSNINLAWHGTIVTLTIPVILEKNA